MNAAPPTPSQRARRPSYVLPAHLAARRSAQQREFAVQGVGIAVAVGCLLGASFLIGPINEIRKERQLVLDPSTIKGLPPDLALLGKLGTFRALAIDWASIRADRLKEEGKVYEAMQLHETVCSLAPRFPKVWANAAWNMAYNISVMQYTPEARWKWVQNGVKILRDQGIQFNPRAVTLYKELAWIYWHKIGDFLDDEHLNYKRAFAVEMETVLGPPPIALADQEYFDWFHKLVAAPRDLAKFIAEDASVAAFAARLAEVSLAPDESLLDAAARHLRTDLSASELTGEKTEVEAITGRRMELLRDPKFADPRDRLLAAVRSHVLRNRYHLDIDWMHDLMVNQYGPLDWRNAYAHSLYWSSLGDKLSEGVESADPSETMNTARFVFFSLQQLITRGRMTLHPNFDDAFESYIELTPDVRYIPYLYDTYMRLGKKHFGDSPRFREGTPGPSYMVGFVTAMHNWIELLIFEGGEENRKQAENYFAWLRENNPHPDGTTQEQYLTSVDEFVMGDILRQLQNFKAATAIIGSFIRQSLKQYSLGLTRAGLSSFLRAWQCYEYWDEDTLKDINERRKIQRPAIMLRDHIIQFMNDGRIDPLAKAQLWRNLPVQQRQMAYDVSHQIFVKICDMQKPPWSLEKAFPEPPGMEEFRKIDIETVGAPRMEGVEQGTRF